MKRTPYHHGSLPSALLDAAETVLERDGIAGLSLRATAREAGVSHAAPAHHFRDLAGLLSALATSGFLRLADVVRAEVAGAGDPRMHVTGLARGYLRFARRHPGLFQLMFRSERLDWSDPDLSSAGRSAFGMLALSSGKPVFPLGLEQLVDTLTRWSLMHGLAMLLIDGRLEAMADKANGAEVEQLIEEVLGRLAIGTTERLDG